uniref:Secreted RxLR effector peptide protein n=1 Tax=Steinernema glaseri TaxID=37863 RepID=A0A1I7ZC30_9BILA
MSSCANNLFPDHSGFRMKHENRKRPIIAIGAVVITPLTMAELTLAEMSTAAENSRNNSLMQLALNRMGTMKMRTTSDNRQRNRIDAIEGTCGNKWKYPGMH